MDANLKKELEAIKQELKADLKREVAEFRKAIRKEVREALVAIINAFARGGRGKINELLEKLR